MLDANDRIRAGTIGRGARGMEVVRQVVATPQLLRCEHFVDSPNAGKRTVDRPPVL